MNMAWERAPSGRWVPPFLFFVLTLVYYFSAQPLMDDPDVPWHLATGRLLLDTGAVPLRDPWSFAADETWYLLSWIWNLLLGVVERAGGLFSVMMLTMAVPAALVAILAGHLLKVGVSLSTVCFIALVAGLSMQDFITARPHLSGYAFSLVFYLILDKSRAGGRLWPLAPMMLVWANTHGSFMAGFVVLGAFGLEALALKQWGWLKKLMSCTLVCGALALINPYGLEVSIGALKTLAGVAKGHTIEWLPFNFTASAGISAWLALMLLSSNLRYVRAPVADKVLAVGWWLSCMMVMRNGPMFVLLSAPYVARCVDEAIAGWQTPRAPSPFALFMEKQKPARVWAAALSGVLVFSVAAAKMPHEDKIISPAMDVRDAIAYAKEHYPDKRFVTDFNFGGQVIYYAGGELKMMMDSRAGTVYSEDVMQAYIDFLYLKPGWEKAFAGLGVEALMISNTLKFAQAYENGDFRKGWQLVFAGAHANVYIARHP